MDEKVLAELMKLKRKTTVSAAIAIFFFALTLLVGLIRPGEYIILFFGLLVVSGILAGINNKRYAAYYKEHVVKEMTLDNCDFLDDLNFDTNAGIPEDEVMNLGVLHGDRYSSNDLITAKYKNVFFRQSDVYVGDVETDSDGHTHEYTVFQGRWMIFDFNKDFNWDLQVVSKNFTSASRLGGILSFGKKKTRKVELEDQAFNKAFRVFAQDEHEAFYILTPHIMEALLNLKAQIKSPLMLLFKGGKLHVAVNNGQDAFEGKIFGKFDLEADKARLLNDLKLITDFVDMLSLERNIFKN